MNRRMKFSTFTAVSSAFLLIVASHSVHASRIDVTDPYFEISDVSTTIESQTDVEVNEDAPLSCFESSSAKPSFIAAEGVDPMAIADLVLKVWEIVKEGKPVVNVDSKSANALPNLAEGDWRRLTGWKRERSTNFLVEVKNGFGVKTVIYKYTLKMIYGGGVGGKGQYISSARIQPTQITVLWGYNLDVSVNIPSVVNQGSEDDPLAAIYMDMNYQIHTVLKSDSRGESYLLQGDGLMMDTKTAKVYFEANPRDTKLASVTK